MRCCADPHGCSGFFDERMARWDLSRYRKKGLDGTARRILDQLVARGVEGRTILEIGGGVGALHLELLETGAARATDVEASPAYEDVAHELLAEHGLADRVDRRVADFAADPDAFGPADVVVMHRVICCYPDMPALVRPAAERARSFLALCYPREAWWLRLAFPVLNVWPWLRRSPFRVYLHSPAAILALAESIGLRPVHHHRGLVWEVAVLERAA